MTKQSTEHYDIIEAVRCANLILRLIQYPDCYVISVTCTDDFDVDGFDGDWDFVSATPTIRARITTMTKKSLPSLQPVHLSWNIRSAQYRVDRFFWKTKGNVRQWCPRIRPNKLCSPAFVSNSGKTQQSSPPISPPCLWERRVYGFIGKVRQRMSNYPTYWLLKFPDRWNIAISAPCWLLIITNGIHTSIDW